MLTIGEKAPEFTLPATGGKTISLTDFTGDKVVVLYFYPRDETPGCTREACYFRDLQSEFEKVGAVILGVSVDKMDSHEYFAGQHNLSFPLLSDVEKTVVNDYGVWTIKNNYGKNHLGIERTTFVIDKEGVIRKIWPKARVEGHADQVLEFVKSLQG